MPKRNSGGKKGEVKKTDKTVDKTDIDALDKALNTDYLSAVQSAMDTVFGHPIFTGIVTDDPLDISNDEMTDTNYKAQYNK